MDCSCSDLMDFGLMDSVQGLVNWACQYYFDCCYYPKHCYVASGCWTYNCHFHCYHFLHRHCFLHEMVGQNLHGLNCSWNYIFDCYRLHHLHHRRSLTLLLLLHHHHHHHYYHYCCNFGFGFVRFWEQHY